MSTRETARGRKQRDKRERMGNKARKSRFVHINERGRSYGVGFLLIYFFLLFILFSFYFIIDYYYHHHIFAYLVGYSDVYTHVITM